jgi:O-antigen ligase
MAVSACVSFGVLPFCLRIAGIETTESARSFAQRLLTAATAVFLFIAPFPSSAGWRTAMLLVALGALSFMKLARGRPWGLREISRPFAVAALAWIALAVASLSWSDDRAYTASELQREVLYGFFAFIVTYAGTRTMRDARTAVLAMLAATLLMGAFEWLRQLMPWLPYAEKYHAAQGPFSTQIALVAPLLAFAAWPAPAGLGVSTRMVGLVAAGLIAAGLATENRMLWLALAAGCVVAFAVFQAGSILDAHRARMMRILLGTLATIAIAIAATFEYKAARYYPEAATPVESVSMDERPLVWSAATSLAAERPLLGHGFGREIVGDRIEEAMPPSASVRIRHAHNMFFDALLQLGAAGLLALAAMLGTLVYAYVRVRHAPAGGAITVTGLALIATFVVKNLTDDFYFRPGSLVFWAINGMLLALASRAVATARRPKAP